MLGGVFSMQVQTQVGQVVDLVYVLQNQTTQIWVFGLIIGVVHLLQQINQIML